MFRNGPSFLTLAMVERPQPYNGLQLVSRSLRRRLQHTNTMRQYLAPEVKEMVVKLALVRGKYRYKKIKRITGVSVGSIKRLKALYLRTGEAVQNVWYGRYHNDRPPNFLLFGCIRGSESCRGPAGDKRITLPGISCHRLSHVVPGRPPLYPQSTSAWLVLWVFMLC